MRRAAHEAGSVVATGLCEAEANIADNAVEEQAALQHAINLVAARAYEIRAQSKNLPSPCISVCRMSAASGWCEGCFRTRDEIAFWSQATDTGKRDVWNLIEQRMAALQP